MDIWHSRAYTFSGHLCFPNWWYSFHPYFVRLNIGLVKQVMSFYTLLVLLHSLPLNVGDNFSCFNHIIVVDGNDRLLKVLQHICTAWRRSSKVLINNVNIVHHEMRHVIILVCDICALRKRSKSSPKFLCSSIVLKIDDFSWLQLLTLAFVLNHSDSPAKLVKIGLEFIVRSCLRMLGAASSFDDKYVALFADSFLWANVQGQTYWLSCLFLSAFRQLTSCCFRVNRSFLRLHTFEICLPTVDLCHEIC